MSHLFRLPVPLILDILDLVLETKNNDISVLSVCRYLRRFAEDVIYRSIELNYAKTYVTDPCYRLHRLIRTLPKRDDLAQRVRFLSISSWVDDSRRCSTLSHLTAVNCLTSDTKEPERVFLRGLGLRHEKVWLEALDGNIVGFYAAIIVMLSPNLIRLNLRLQDGFEFVSQVLDPTFSLSHARPQTLSSLRSLDYGYPLPLSDDDCHYEAYAVGDITPLFYLPALTTLSLTGMGGGKNKLKGFKWPSGKAPRSRLAHLDITGAEFDMTLLEELLAACPHLVSIDCNLEDTNNPELIFYQRIVKALTRVKSTVTRIAIRLCTNHDYPRREVDIERIGSFRQFSRLERLEIPLVAYMGSNPREADALERVLPPMLKYLRLTHGNWIVGCEKVLLYWPTMCCQLMTLLRQKHESVPRLETLNLHLTPRPRDKLDVRKLHDELHGAGEEVGVRVSVWNAWDGWHFDRNECLYCR